jgi:hypothetical protein
MGGGREMPIMTRSGGKLGQNLAVQRDPDLNVAEALCCTERYKFYSKPRNNTFE